MSRIESTADVAENAEIGGGTLIWHQAQVREGASLGSNCVVGRGAYIGPGVQIGDNCKIQNHALVYEPSVLGNGVFVGPAAVFTNDTYPRAVNPDGSLKSAADWHPVGVVVEDGASIGARTVCIAPLRIGRWATVAAGAVVTRDVPSYAVVAGVPARQVGWVGPAGYPLAQGPEPEDWSCPVTGDCFRLEASGLQPVPRRGAVSGTVEERSAT
ncbi:acyltransferase [Arthrobacter luteolus]|uniref:acyltransferase n=1 Tax=Arthrobacter luteolus TaxID=98672 RepID=UPI00082F9A15|nr:acyltransferase [Arthrobacter luteolus]